MVLHFLAACLNTEIPPPALSPDLFELTTTAPKRIVLETETMSRASVGHQFLLFAIPFGRIKLSDVARTLLHTAYSRLAQREYRPLLVSKAQVGSDLSYKHLTIVLQDVSISAYDFIFFRRIRCRVRLLTKLHDPSTNSILEVASVGRASELRKFAFKPQLERQFMTALNSALDDGFEALGL